MTWPQCNHAHKIRCVFSGFVSLVAGGSHARLSAAGARSCIVVLYRPVGCCTYCVDSRSLKPADHRVHNCAWCLDVAASDNTEGGNALYFACCNASVSLAYIHKLCTCEIASTGLGCAGQLCMLAVRLAGAGHQVVCERNQSLLGAIPRVGLVVVHGAHHDVIVALQSKPPKAQGQAQRNVGCSADLERQ